MENSKEKTQFFQAGALLMIIVALLALTKIVTEVKSYKYVGSVSELATISFSGTGEVFAAPDIATVNITVREEGATVKDAQTKATAKEKKVLDYLAEQGIEKKDIKTENYNSYPKYDYGAPCYDGYCPSRTPKVIGYEVSEYISVKIRNLEKAGEVAGGVGALGAAEISGPNYMIENEDEVRAEARKEAIDEAKAKAEALAEDLGVRLVRIVSFSEGGNYPMPAYGRGVMSLDVAQEKAAAPELPAGENQITSSVTITYEIR